MTSCEVPVGRILTREAAAEPVPGRLTRSLRYPTRAVVTDGAEPSGAWKSMRNVCSGVVAVQASTMQSAAQLVQLSPCSRRPLPHVAAATVAVACGLGVAVGVKLAVAAAFVGLAVGAVVLVGVADGIATTAVSLGVTVTVGVGLCGAVALGVAELCGEGDGGATVADGAVVADAVPVGSAVGENVAVTVTVNVAVSGAVDVACGDGDGAVAVGEAVAVSDAVEVAG